jgi:hypothetical protein
VDRVNNASAPPIDFMGIRKKFHPPIQVFPFSSNKKRMGSLILIKEEDSSENFVDKNGLTISL